MGALLLLLCCCCLCTLQSQQQQQQRLSLVLRLARYVVALTRKPTRGCVGRRSRTSNERAPFFFFSSQKFLFSIFLLPLAGFLICCTNCAPEQLHLPFEATSAALVIRSRRAVAAAGAQGLLAEHCFFFFVAFFSVFPSNRMLVFKCKDGL